MYYFVEPPRILSWVDAVAGGGRGTEEVATAVPFGTTGQTLDVWRPAGDHPTTSRPVLIFYYGGGWVHGDRGAYAFAARAYAKAGFVVVVPDYRKVPSVRFPAFLQDAAEAVKWTRDNIAGYGGDPTRIATAGHSAGGYAAIMLPMDPHWLTAIGVDPHIIKAAVGLCGPYDFFPYDKKRSIDAFKGVVDGPATQPIHYARAGLAPMMLVTASNDTQVRPYNAVNLTKALKKAGSPVEFREYQGLSHEDVAMALSVPFRGKAPALSDSVSFLKRVLK
ncbi:alpha/beta hydrolase [Sphingomonas oligophenolica]|uniref:Alpha/beta hydrolase n=2 Tax=Sphingomonas oligophenolica TaxID=301154 RepID=A0A502CHZ7_9SPHN|nr:alpha/beta hydrolase [Sphingomonas oligophenolica]